MNDEPMWTRLAAGRMLPTARGVLQLIFAGVLYAAGANVGAGWVVVLAAVLAGTVVAGYTSLWRAARRVEVRRLFPAVAVAGVPVKAVLEVRAPGAGRLFATDALTGLVGDGASGSRFVGSVVPRRGATDGAEVDVGLSDRFGVVRGRASGHVRTPYLAVPAIPAVAPDALHTTGDAEDRAVVRARSGPEFGGLRAYAPGDPVRSVSWRASARHGRLVVGEALRPAAPMLRIAIEGRIWQRDALDRACDRACGLAAAATADGRPVEIAADGAVRPWSNAVRRDLAVLPPHAGAPPRPLAPAPVGSAETVTL